MSFPDEMQRLADHFHASHESRAEAITTIRHAVTALRAGATDALGEIHAEHRAMRRALEQRLRDAHAARHSVEQKRQGGARQAAHDRSSYVGHVRATTASMRASTMSRLQEITRDHRQAHSAWIAVGTSVQVPADGLAATGFASPKSRRGKRG